MKNISVKKISIIGTIFMILTGSFLHFAYQLSGDNQIVAVFSAVNESVWEHGKLFILPLICVAAVNYLKAKDLSKILFIFLSELIIMLGFVYGFFYTYTGALGIENLFIDISSFIVAVIIGQYYAYKKLIGKKPAYLNKYYSMICWIIILTCFAVFTYFPPNLPIFIANTN